MAEDEGRHMARAVRRGVGDLVELRDGRGGWARGRITGTARGEVRVELLDVGKAADDRLPVWVLLPLLKREAMEEALTKLCELGVARIIPMVCSRSVARPGRMATRLERWRGLAVAALKQSRGFYLTEIHGIQTLDEVVAGGLPGDWARLLLHPAEGRPFSTIWASSSKGAVLSLGPEGGLTDDEYKLLIEKGFSPISLGSRILRASTAAVVATFFSGIWLRRGG